MRIKLIANAHAGRKAGLSTNSVTLDDVLAALAAHGMTPDVERTQRPGHATDLARAATTAGYDVVIAAGGDGTVRETAVGLLGAHVPLGIMPIGSVMNVARMLAIPRDLAGAAAVIATGDCAHIDVGRAGTAYFLEAAGVGIDGALFPYFNKLDQGEWNALGRALWVALRYRSRRVTLELDGWTVEMPAMMVTVANGPYCGAAFVFAPGAKVDDHRLDVRVYGSMSKLALLRRLLRRGSHGHAERMYSFRARDIRIASAQPLPGHADANPIGVTPFRFTLMPGALSVFVGSEVRDHCHGLSQPPHGAALA